MFTVSIKAHSESISAIFKDWQIKALACIPNSNGTPIGSGPIYDLINRKGCHISRASVINFLEALRKLDLIEGILTTGKGGKRFDYKFNVDRSVFNLRVALIIMGALKKEYPDMYLEHVADRVTRGTA